MPFAIALMFPTIDMKTVYDEGREHFMPRIALPVIALWIGLGILSASALGQQHPSMPMGPPPEPDTSRVQQEMETRSTTQTLHLAWGKKTADWTPEKLAALPHTAITVLNGHSGATETYSGVPLLALLEPLGFPAKPHGKDFRLYLVAQGADGYAVVYAMAEIIPEVHDATVLVADAMNGKPIESAGPFELIATGEKHPARWVHNLHSIRVEAAK